MSPPKPKLLAHPEPDHAFSEKWAGHKLATYIEEYGGERKGVPKGEDIPFPPHKVKAAVALLAYGAPKQETLTAIARRVGVSSALLRVWRTETRFLDLYRRVVWECTDDYIRLLAVELDVEPFDPREVFQECFGVAVQQAILRRLCVDLTQMVPEWRPIGLDPKWLSECALVGSSPKAIPLFTHAQTKFLKTNTHLLLGHHLVRPGIRNANLSHWAQITLLRQWSVNRLLNDITDALEKGAEVDVLGLLKWITASTPIDDLKRFHLEMKRTRMRRKTR